MDPFEKDEDNYLACSLTAAKYNAASTFLLALAQLQAHEFVV